MINIEINIVTNYTNSIIYYYYSDLSIPEVSCTIIYYQIIILLE